MRGTSRAHADDGDADAIVGGGPGLGCGGRGGYQKMTAVHNSLEDTTQSTATGKPDQSCQIIFIAKCNICLRARPAV